MLEVVYLGVEEITDGLQDGFSVGACLCNYIPRRLYQDALYSVALLFPKPVLEALPKHLESSSGCMGLGYEDTGMWGAVRAPCSV